ncbi:hypothetical protein [Bradyrhizobium sp. USDA 4454]
MRDDVVAGAESPDGARWPVFLEWSSSGWHRSAEVKQLVTNETLKAMTEKQVFLFDENRLTRVFSGIEESKFSDIEHAIEYRVSSYDAETEEDVVL